MTKYLDKTGLTYFWEKAKSKIYPVGSIYMSVNSTSPAMLFGGTWEQIKGRFLVGTGWNDANTITGYGELGARTINFPAGDMGGEPWHTLTVDEMPTHNHSGTGGEIEMQMWRVMGGGDVIAFAQKVNIVQETLEKKVGGGKSYYQIPPYLSVYMWKRTA